MKYNIKKIQGNKMKFAKSVFMILLLVFIFMGYCGFTFDNKSFAGDNKDSNSSKKAKIGRSEVKQNRWFRVPTMKFVIQMM